jgi:hypothetical protein
MFLVVHIQSLVAMSDVIDIWELLFEIKIYYFDGSNVKGLKGHFGKNDFLLH